MYFNLKTEIKRKGMLQKEVAHLIDMTLVTFNSKLNGIGAYTDFTINEKQLIYNTHFSDMDYDYIFKWKRKGTYEREFGKESMTITELVDQAYDNAKEKGFYDRWNIEVSSEEDKNNFITAQLMRIVSEAVEALQALEIGDMENFAVELADIPIRVASLCGLLEIDLQGEIERKMEENKARGYMHGKRF